MKIEELVQGTALVDADKTSGYDDVLGKSVCYELDRLAGPMLRLSRAATGAPGFVFRVCDENGSLLIMNKCYGQELEVPVANGGTPEVLPVFSAFIMGPKTADEARARFDPETMVYMPTYGGMSPDGVPLPCLMDRRTQDLFASNGMGWRMLMFKGDAANGTPPGIVAAEGWYFTLGDDKTVHESAEASARAYYAIVRAAQDPPV